MVVFLRPAIDEDGTLIMENVFLKPACDAEGNAMVVPDPETHLPLKAVGEWKALTTYWVRRIRDVDVMQSAAPDETSAAAPPMAAAAGVEEMPVAKESVPSTDRRSKN
jgi:hypothetical protein